MNNEYTTENYISDKLTKMQLVNLRKSKHITMKELSEKSGLSISCISNIETGYPNLKSIIKYLDALGYEFQFVKKSDIDE